MEDKEKDSLKSHNAIHRNSIFIRAPHEWSDKRT